MIGLSVIINVPARGSELCFLKTPTRPQPYIPVVNTGPALLRSETRIPWQVALNRTNDAGLVSLKGLSMTIKAIETEYKGYRFRSRLEARYAVFFDALNLKWEYEKEGYTLSNGVNYLPDFWIRFDKTALPDWGFYIEIKPCEPTHDERLKLHLLAKDTGHTVVCFWGLPGSTDWHATFYKGQRGGECWMTDGLYTESPIGFVSIGTYENEGGGESYRYHYLPFGYQFTTFPDSTKKHNLKRAFTAATSARFEFGEKG